ncbi:hypothetical protein IGI04_036488 [Brassica rapa subsp. trilocularis]|uniref:Shugoshin C-terminal domain-containing protein n=1 Tax=Brassica rapa subsp. trilocularis TaxID=1813537 RepID=A0ABQ7LHM1_BRACM|nr:hypothetical protein IGI04_036488 [Brassica rapa subsp. trilocularis]
MVATPVLQRDENGDMHDPEGHLCNAAVSLVEQDVEKDENHDHIQMMEKIIRIQQKTSTYLNLRLDVLFKGLNRKYETLDGHVRMLDAHVSQTAKAVKKQEALVKEKTVESERHQVDVISDNYIGEVLEQEKLKEDAFLVESSMSIGSSYWCRSTPTTEHQWTPTTKHRSTLSVEHQSTSSAEHRSTPLLGSDKTVRIQNHSNFAARHPHPPILYCAKRDNIDRQQYNEIDRQRHGKTERQQQPSSDKCPPLTYRVRLPSFDVDRLNATRNQSQTSICLKTPEKTSQKPADAPKQEQSIVAETSFIESIIRRHKSDVDRCWVKNGHDEVNIQISVKISMNAFKKSNLRKEIFTKNLAVKSCTNLDREPAGRYVATDQATRSDRPNLSFGRSVAADPERIRSLRSDRTVSDIDQRVRPKSMHSRLHKRVKRVPKDMSFEDAYYKYRLGNFFRESRETDKDIGLLFNKVSCKPKRTLKKEQDPGKFMIPFTIHSHNLPNALCDTGSAELISCIEMFEDPGPTADSNREPAILDQRRSTLELQHRSTFSPHNRSTISLQHRTTLSA